MATHDDECWRATRSPQWLQQDGMHTEEEELHDERGHQRRDEAVRRVNLYGVTSQKRLPKVKLAPRDARTRHELQVLVAPQQLVVHDGLSVYEDELEQRKQHDRLGMRPALDQSQPLRDLFTTVPRQLHHAVNDSESSSTNPQHAREWRMGYKNDPQSDYHGGGMRGVFEPTDSLRESLLSTATYRQSTIALAYPQPHATDTQFAKQLDPHDEDKNRKDVETKLHVGMLSPTTGGRSKPHWSPASLGIPASVPDGKKKKQKPPKAAVAINQRCAVRKVHRPLQKSALAADERCVGKRQAAVAVVNDAYNQLQQQAQQAKDPTVRYSLPIENPVFERSYRLGLDPIPSSSSVAVDQDRPADPTEPIAKARTCKPRLFRPKSAVSLRMDTAMSPASKLGRSSSSTSLLIATTSCAKVAGAKRRPHSATVSYLPHSTVYCMSPSPTAANNSQLATTLENAHEIIKHQRKFGAEFLSIVLEERARREQNQRQSLADLAARGVLHSIPMPQIFARLRREAMKNLTTRVEIARYDKLSMDEYMSLCGMAVVPGTSMDKHVELRRRRAQDPNNHDQDEDGEEEEEEEEEEEDTTAQCYVRFKEDLQEEDPVVQGLRDELELRHLPFDTEPPGAVFRKRKAIRPDPVDGNNSSTILAIRRALFVTREQFHIAMEAFALQSRDVNLLFSAVDLAVEDRVPVWGIICAIEQLQDGHEEVRRSRVKVKAAKHLPKELAPLRRSVTFPHLTHVPLPI